MAKALSRLAVALGLALAAGAAHAGHALGAKIVWLHIYENGVVVFHVSAPTRVDPPPCATNTNGFAFDLASPGGPAMLDYLLRLKMQSGSIDVKGTGTCPPFKGNAEGVLFLRSAEPWPAPI